ncbi:MAG TPA: hypothetical protein VMP08_16150, partial [Anaerolineae bacterium]|nr:hypothetical protein [Anaerolineae bacterium]
MFRLDRYHKGVLLGCTIFLSALTFSLVQPTRSTPLTPVVWTVTTLDDPGAPTCAVTCSLRTAVNMAAPDDTIVFDASIFSAPLTITLQGQIEISKALTIDGVAGGGITPTLSGNHLTRTFQVDAGASVTLNALNLVDGYCSLCDGGGIYNRGTLSITNSNLNHNATSDGTPDPCSIPFQCHCFYTNDHSISSLTQNILNGKGARNDRLPEGPGDHGAGSGGGIFNDGTLFIANSTLADNVTGKGVLYDGQLVAYDGGDGGGIFNRGALFLVGSSLSRNVTGGGGDRFRHMGGKGGYGGGIYNAGTVSITSSTLSGNATGPGGAGGW